MLVFFQKIIDSLNASNVPYMLSGSIAMSAYVTPRSTRDFDFVIHLTPNQVKNFVSQFSSGYYCNIDSVHDAVKNHFMFNIIDEKSGYKADFMILKNELYRQTEFERRVTINLFEREVYIVTVEDLLLSKLIWIQTYQSAIQMDDIKLLSMLPQIDWSYVTKWIQYQKLSTFNIFKI